MIMRQLTKKARIAWMILLTGWSITTQAQQSQRISQSWEFLRQDLGSPWEAVRPATEGSPESVPLWEKISLPHCFNAKDAVDPDVNYYQGPGWYRTQLDIRNPYDKGRTLLHFEGAGQKTTVYVYTTRVAQHTGGYDEWNADITDAVQQFLASPAAKNFKGKVPVSIRCDNTRDVEMIPSSMSDFNVYGGIYRYLNLVYTPAITINNIQITPQTDAAGKTGKVELSLTLSDNEPLKEGSIDIQVVDPAGKPVKQWSQPLTPGKTAISLNSFELKKPALWSPAQPQLYTLKAVLKSPVGNAEWSAHFGFRHFEFANHGPFLLNGQRLLLKGTHRHEDHAGVAAAMTEDMIRQEMLLIKSMGANFIRLGHYQQSRIVLNLCDSLGILVWEEIPWCRGGLGGPVYQEQGRRMLTNMIQQHYNHPAVILWGLGNENDWPGDFPEFDKQKIRDYMSALNQLAHQLDNTRKTTIRRCDFCKDIVDVYSPSIWAGWYRGIYTEYKTETLKAIADVPHFFHAEWGADSHQGRHAEDPEFFLGNITTGKGADERTGDFARTGGNARASRDGDWSETYACNLIDWHLKEQETMPTLTGSAYWIFKDFSTPLRPDNPVPYVNQKGVVGRDLLPKESFYVFQSYWAEQPMAHIYGHNWPVRWGKAGETKKILVYSNCPEAELFVNGKSMGAKKRNSQDFPAAGLHWEISLQEGKYDVKVIARKGKTTVEDQVHFDYQTATWKKPASLIVEKQQEATGVTLIKVKAVDKNNVLCLDAKNYITFSIAGDGTLLDDLGTATGSRKVQLANGQAQIRVQTKGRNVVSAVGEGLSAGFVEL